MQDGMRIGIDWGGTKIEAIALDRDGAELLRRRIRTPREDYDGCIRAVSALVASIEGELGRRGSVGIGIPGSISRATGLVQNANSTWMNGRPLDRDLEAALARPVRIENDANCLAVSEATDGAGAGARLVWAVILGTGVGSGIAIDGRALSGRNGVAGEWGHNPLPGPRADELPGPPCYCGRRGCIETFLSGPALAADHGARTGGTLTAEAVVAAARQGDPEAGASLERYRTRLARGFASVINLLDPDVIVLGGGLSNVPELFHDLPARLAPYLFADRVDTPIRPSRHGDSSGVRGAAWLWNSPGEAI